MSQDQDNGAKFRGRAPEGSVAAIAARGDANAEWLKAIAGSLGGAAVINNPKELADYLKWVTTRVAQLTEQNKRLDREVNRFRTVARSAISIQAELVAD